MRTLLLLPPFIAVLLAGHGASAAEGVAQESIAPPGSAVITVEPASAARLALAGVTTRNVPSQRLVLSQGKSELVRLQSPAHEVLVADPTIADVSVSSQRQLFIIARKIGETNVFVVNSAGEQIARFEVSVGPDADAARAVLSYAMPDVPLSVSAVGTALVLSGTVQSDGDAGRAAALVRRYVTADENMVNLLKVSRDQQVLIQVRVAEVQRRALKEIGSLLDINTDPARKMNHVSVSGSTSMLGLNPLGEFAGTFRLEGIRDLFVTLSLLEQRGLVRNLAEPNLVAVSGETATMLAGGEIPIPVPDRDGIKIEFKPFGVSLSFLPVILDTGNISLKMSTEVSSLSTDRVDVPLLSGRAAINAFVVRRAASTVELPSGGSLMMAGLIQNDMISGISGIPGAMDLPILGQLFRSDSFKRNETELVVIVTATLVRPSASAALVTPADSVAPSSDSDLWVFGRLVNRFAPGFVQDSQAPVSFGFTIDEIKP